MHLVRRPCCLIVFATAIWIGSVLIDAPVLHADEYRAQSTIGKFVDGLNPQNWKMPKMSMPKMAMPKIPMLQGLLPGQEEKQRIKMRKDSLVKEVADSAKRSWEKTKDTLNPKRLIPAGFLSSNDNSDSGGGVQQAGFFSSLLGGGQEPERAQTNAGTVDDFLRNNRPIR